MTEDWDLRGSREGMRAREKQWEKEMAQGIRVCVIGDTQGE